MIIATDFDGTVANYGATVGSAPEFNTALLLQWVQLGVTGVAVATNQGALGMGLLEWKTPEGAPYPSPSHFARRINEFHAALRVYGIPLVCVKVATYHTRGPSGQSLPRPRLRHQRLERKARNCAHRCRA